MKVKAYAKVNLALDVICKREDGYHDLDMIMAPISLYDELDIEFSKEYKLTCDDSALVLDEHNTITKAVELMRLTFKLKENFSIHLNKNIPTQAGLGGGSADCAAVLHAINQMCRLNCSLEELIGLGVQVGADVPFCLVNQVSRVKGIGEIVKPIKYNFSYALLLVKPKSGVSTKDAFQNIDFSRCYHPDIDAIEKKMINGDDSFVHDLENTLEVSACSINEEIKLVKDRLLEYSFDKVLMSGSGSCIFAMSRDKSLLDKGAKDLKDKGNFVKVVNIL